jgi:pimeloyl-ACP methyl ester carboxylesterase
VQQNCSHRVRFIFVAIVLFLSALSYGAEIHAQPLPIGRTVRVPLDHRNPALGTAPLYFEFGAPYDKRKPVVFIIADAQQYYVRRGSVQNLQKTLFGDDFNVVGIVGRGSSEKFIKAALNSNGQPDWLRAWRIFNSEQWIEDIDSVRRSIVGNNGKILLYGRSGGGFLVHQYLVRHGAHVQRAFTSSALNPFIVNELGLNSDHFWEEIGAYDKNLQPTLRKVLEAHPTERATMIMTLQRQNFFVPVDKLAAARADLIRDLADGNTKRYEEAQTKYQVDLIQKTSDSPEEIAARVRIYEFFQPSGGRSRLNTEAIYPDLENQYNIAKPLLLLADSGKIPSPTFDFTKLHRVDTEVFILAGRWDHTADYRSLSALAHNYSRHTLFIADDNHVFARLNEKGLVNPLVQSFLLFGSDSNQFKEALNVAGPFRWTEQ